MRYASICAALMATFILCTGCAHYTAEGKMFSSSSDALQYQSESLPRVLDGITPTDNPLHGKAIVLFPSDSEIRNNYIALESVTFTRSMIPNELLNFLVMAPARDCQFLADAIRKRGIFDSVTVERHNGNPASLPMGDFDCMVFLDVDGWFLKVSGNPRALLIPFDKSILFDTNFRAGPGASAPKAYSMPFEKSKLAAALGFLDSINQQTNILRGK